MEIEVLHAAQFGNGTQIAKDMNIVLWIGMQIAFIIDCYNTTVDEKFIPPPDGVAISRIFFALISLWKYTLHFKNICNYLWCRVRIDLKIQLLLNVGRKVLGSGRRQFS